MQKFFFPMVTQPLHDAFAFVFRDTKNCRVGLGDFQSVLENNPIDFLVTPGNSFGLMDGGLDLTVREYYRKRGELVEEVVLSQIAEHYAGECPVGECFVVETDNTQTPNLIYAPTMRFPTTISSTPNVYLATLGILNKCKNLADVSVVLPALGAGTGGVQPMSCALQIRLAMWAFNQPQSRDWAVQRHRLEFLQMAINQQSGLVNLLTA